MDSKNNNINKHNCCSKMHIFLTLLVIIGSINWGLDAIGFNIVNLLCNWINGLLKTNFPINKIIYIVVAIAGISLAIKKYTWLPFLGWTVFPDAVLDTKIPAKYDTKVKILTKPNSKIVYWAAFGKNINDQDVYTAYGDLSNSGVVLSDSNGFAELFILEGGGYSVPSGLKLQKHIHYRIAEPNAIMSDVKTIFY